MKRVLGIVTVCTAALVSASALAQQQSIKPPSPARLELSFEVTSTTDEGYPAILQITLKNVGDVTLDLPWEKAPCLPDGGVEVQSKWTASDPNNPMGSGGGSGCGVAHSPSLSERIKTRWIRLRPGESFISSENFRSHYRGLEPGTVEYWVDFSPPFLTAQELAESVKAGYVIPTEILQTPHRSFALP